MLFVKFGPKLDVIHRRAEVQPPVNGNMRQNVELAITWGFTNLLEGGYIGEYIGLNPKQI